MKHFKIQFLFLFICCPFFNVHMFAQTGSTEEVACQANTTVYIDSNSIVCGSADDDF